MIDKKLFIKGLKIGLIEFGYNISRIINLIFLTIIYIFGIGLTALLAKLKKKRFLETKFTHKKTYWSKLNLKRKPLDKYTRQF